MGYFRIGVITVLIGTAAYVLWHAIAKPWLESLSEVDEMEELRRGE